MTEEATKFGGMPGHIPKQVRVKIGTKYGGKHVQANREYFDLYRDCQTKDWQALNLPDPNTPVGELFAPKKSRYTKDNSVFIDNYPIKVRLASADESSIYRGGTKESLQVLIPQGYIVNISSDVFFESLMRDGWNADTKELNSEFIIATVNRTTKLVRIGSDLHDAVLERMAADNKPKLDVKTMSVGEVYETKAGNKALFLGFVSTKHIKTKYTKDNNRKIINIEPKYSNMKIGTLWLALSWSYDKTSSKTLQYSFDKALKEKRWFFSEVSFKTKSGHGYVKKCPNLYVNVPNDIIRSVRLKEISKATTALEHYGDQDCSKFAAWLQTAIDWYAKNPGKSPSRRYGYSYNRNRNNLPQFNPPDHWDIQELTKYTKRTNMTVFGMQPEAHETSKKTEKVIELWNEMKKRKIDPHDDYSQ